MEKKERVVSKQEIDLLRSIADSLEKQDGDVKGMILAINYPTRRITLKIGDAKGLKTSVKQI